MCRLATSLPDGPQPFSPDEPQPFSRSTKALRRLRSLLRWIRTFLPQPVHVKPISAPTRVTRQT